MDWLVDFSYYILGCFAFFVIFYAGFRMLNKILIDAATSTISDIIDEFKKDSLPRGKTEDEIKIEKNKEKEISQEKSVYQDQIDLEVLERQADINSDKKSSKKIIGLNVKDLIKGRWTKMLAAKKIEMLQSMDLETLQNYGVNQAMLQAQRGGQAKGSGVQRQL